MDKNHSNNELVEESKNEQNETKNKKTIYINQIYKALILFFAILVVVTGIMMLRNNIYEDKIDGKVVYLTELSDVRTNFINVKSYEKEGLSRIEDVGEYGGGSVSLDDGKYFNYSLYPNEKIVMKLYNDDNSLLFEKTIKQDNNEEIYPNDFYITENDEILISVNHYINETDKVFSKITKYNLKGEVLSELKLDGVSYISNVDSVNSITAIVFSEDYKNKKIIKVNDKNETIFELNLESIETMVFVYEDKIITFKPSNNGVCLQIFDEKGKEIFNKENSNFSLNTISKIVPLSNGDFLIEEGQYVEEKDYYGYKLNSIVKVDSQFNELWKKEINKIAYNSNIIELNNEYIIIMDETYNVKDINKQAKVISITKFDSSGNQKLCKYLGYDDNDEGDIINDGYIDMDGHVYVKDEKIILKATTFKNDMSIGCVTLEIDSNGNIS